MVPIRLVTRNRWWTIAWAAGICWTAMELAGGGQAGAPEAPNAQAPAADRAGDANVNAALALLDDG